MEIGLAFLASEFRDSTFNDYLPFEREPRKVKRGPRVRLQFAALATLVVRVENKAAPIESFKQNRSRGGATVASGGGENHGVWLRQLGRFGLLKPFLELAEWIAG